LTGLFPGDNRLAHDLKEVLVPNKSANVKNEKQYEALKDKGMSKERAAKIANSPGASSRGGKKSGSSNTRSSSSQGGTTAQKKAAGRKGGKASAKKS
jgi:hypothetical protein